MSAEPRDKFKWAATAALVAVTSLFLLVLQQTRDFGTALGFGLSASAISFTVIFYFLLQQSFGPRFLVGTGVTLLLGAGVLTPAIQAIIDVSLQPTSGLVNWSSFFIERSLERLLHTNLTTTDWIAIVMSFTLVFSGVYLALDRNSQAAENVRTLLADKENLLTENQGLRKEIEDAVIALPAQLTVQNAVERIREAEGELANGNVALAEAIYAEVAERKSSEGSQAYVAAAQAFRRLGALTFLHDTERSLAAYRSATELDPANLSGWNQLGHLLQRIGKLSAAESIYRRILSSVQSLGDFEAIAYGNLGNIYHIRGELDDAIKMYKKAYVLDEKLGNKEGIAAACGNLGNIYRIRGKLDEAELMYRNSLSISKALGNKEAIAMSYVNLGTVYRIRGKLDDAITMHRKALPLFEALSHKEGLAVAYGTIGLVHKTRGELSEAVTMYKKSLALNTALNRAEGIAADYLNLGVVHKLRGELDEAVAMYEKSLTIQLELGNKEGMASAYGNLGLIYKDRGNLEEAVSMYQKAQALDEELDHKEGLASHYGNLGNIHHRRGELDDALSMYEKSLAIEKELGRKEGMAADYLNLGVVHKLRGEFKKAREEWNCSLKLYEELELPTASQVRQGLTELEKLIPSEI